MSRIMYRIDALTQLMWASGLKEATAMPTPKATPATEVSLPARLSNGKIAVAKSESVLPTTMRTPSRSITTVRRRALNIEFIKRFLLGFPGLAAGDMGTNAAARRTFYHDRARFQPFS